MDIQLTILRYNLYMWELVKYNPTIKEATGWSNYIIDNRVCILKKCAKISNLLDGILVMAPVPSPN